MAGGGFCQGGVEYSAAEVGGIQRERRVRDVVVVGGFVTEELSILEDQ